MAIIAFVLLIALISTIVPAINLIASILVPCTLVVILFLSLGGN